VSDTFFVSSEVTPQDASRAKVVFLFQLKKSRIKMADSDSSVTDPAGDKQYFTIIPNMVAKVKLDVYEFRLYFHLKMVAGERGLCWQSRATMAEACEMSESTVSKAEHSLAKKGLITIVKKKSEHGGRDYFEISIVDIWAKNFKTLEESRKDSATSSHDLATSPENLARSPSTHQEEPINKIQEKEESSLILNGEDNLGTKELSSITEEKREGKESKRKEPENPQILNPSQVRYAQVEALAEVCKMDLKMNKGPLMREAKMLDKSPEDIRRLYGAGGPWYRVDWRGKKGECPTPSLIRGTWVALEEAARKSGKVSATNQPENYVTMDKTPRGESTRTLGGSYIDPEDGGYVGL
jgi:predicted transcriptional regulator